MATAPEPRRPSSARSRAPRAFGLRFGLGMGVYALALALAVAAEGAGLPAWPPALLVLPGIALMAQANIGMYRSGDELERRKVAESVLLAFVLSTALLLAVGFLQFFLLPAINWIFAFSILMVSWAAGTVVTALRYR